MKIAHLTTWNSRCGISEYAELLVKHLIPLVDEEQIVYANKTSPNTKVSNNSYPTIEVFSPVYLEGQWWGASIELPTVIPDVLHVQLQTNLYDVCWLNAVLEIFHNAGSRTIATFHDSGVWPEFHWKALDVAIGHRADTVGGMPTSERYVVPRGIPVRPVRLGSFAFGRNPHGEIQQIAEELGFQWFVHNPMEKWLSHSELIDWLSTMDGLVLFYPQTGASVSSGALRTALAARRPIFVSDTSWFKEAFSPLVHKFKTKEELKEGLKNYFFDPMIDAYSFDTIAREHMKIYKKENCAHLDIPMHYPKT